MKNPVRNTFLIAAMAFTLLSFDSKAFAGTRCSVLITKTCLVATSLPVNLYFPDGFTGANMNAARCVERAREYKQWCRTPGLEAVSVFDVDGLNVIAGHTTSGGKTYISDGIARFTNFHD